MIAGYELEFSLYVFIMQQAVITCVMTSSGPGLFRAKRGIPDFEFDCPGICAFLKFLHVGGLKYFIG